MLLAVFDCEVLRDKVAVIFDGQRWTYGEIAAESRTIAAGLQSHGVNKGDRVALYFRNSPTYLSCLLACWRIGAIAVPIRRWQPGAMAVDWCNFLGVSVMLVEQPLVDNIAPRLHELASVSAVFATAGASGSMRPWSELARGDYRPVAVEATDPVLILHTSGTTARPKAIWHSMRSMTSRATGQLDCLPLDSSDVVCVFSDCTHGFGMQVMLTPALAVGATVVLMAEFDPAAILDAIAEHRATVTGAAPGYLLALIEEARRREALDVSSLRFVLTASDKPPETLHRDFSAAFGAVPLLEAFGMTEACGCILANTLADNRIGTVGRPFTGVRFRIVGRDGRDVPDGAVGELWVTGDCLFGGYWNEPELTAQAMVDSWLKTGDQAIRDEGGRCQLVGRSDFMIKRGGIYVSPFEIEAALMKHAAIADCVAAGAPSDRWGQEAEAFVVLRGQTSLAQLTAHVVQELGEPSRPVRFWSIDRIPRTNLGKVDRKQAPALRQSATLVVD